MYILYMVFQKFLKIINKFLKFYIYFTYQLLRFKFFLKLYTYFTYIFSKKYFYFNATENFSALPSISMQRQAMSLLESTQANRDEMKRAESKKKKINERVLDLSLNERQRRSTRKESVLVSVEMEETSQGHHHDAFAFDDPKSNIKQFS